MATNELSVISPAGTGLPTTLHIDLVDAFLAGRAATTLRSYAGDLEDFARFSGHSSAKAATNAFIALAHGSANAVALRYKADMMERGLAPATINRRLAAIRSLVKLARTLGLIPWTLDIEGVRHESYRDTKGPGRQGFVKLVDALDDRLDGKAKRDRAIVRLLFDLALRREEVVRLDVADVNLEDGFILVTGKGKREPIRVTLPLETQTVISEWISERGLEPGPLFTNFDRAGKGSGRLSGTAVYQIIRALGLKTGQTVRPHGLRHASITFALDVTDGNVRKVQQHSRHRTLETLMRYDDARKDVAGEVAARVARGR
jgi:integrase/recombinase XerC